MIWWAHWPSEANLSTADGLMHPYGYMGCSDYAVRLPPKSRVYVRVSPTKSRFAEGTKKRVQKCVHMPPVSCTPLLLGTASRVPARRPSRRDTHECRVCPQRRSPALSLHWMIWDLKHADSSITQWTLILIAVDTIDAYGRTFSREIRTTFKGWDRLCAA